MRVPKVPRKYCENDRSVRVYPPTGTVYTGMGAVWENLTCGLPVLNPTLSVNGLRLLFLKILAWGIVLIICADGGG
jgi:hypothetical protein